MKNFNILGYPKCAQRRFWSAATLENVPFHMCAQRGLKTACASAQSDQSLRCEHEEILHPWLSKNAPNEDSDQTARMRRLIWIFAGRSCPKLRFLILRLIYRSHVLFSHNMFHTIFLGQISNVYIQYLQWIRHMIYFLVTKPNMVFQTLIAIF